MSAHALTARRAAAPDHVRLLRGGGRSRRLRRFAVVALGVAGVGAFAAGGLWWRLGSGPLPLDVVTPWLTAALEEKLGGGHRVEVGGTVLERDEDGRTALRLRDVVVRDAQGHVVASAPKAEVGIAGSSLLTGHVRAERLSLIGAEMALRIEPDGQVRVFAAASEDHALASVAAAAGSGAVYGTAAAPDTAADSAEQPSTLAAVVGWLQSLDAAGFDGRDLVEIGLKNGSLAVADGRTGKQLTFDKINLSLTRLEQGGAAIAVSSVGHDGPWSLNATVTPRGDGVRALEAVVRDLSPKDIILALRLGNGDMQADMPLSAVVRAEIGADGVPRMLHGRIVGGAGYIGDRDDEASRILIDEIQAELRWDQASRMLHAPIEVQAGPNRVALLGQVAPPQEPGGPWSFGISQGMVLLADAGHAREPPLMLDRVSLRGVFDAAKRRIVVEQGGLRGVSAGVAFSGMFDYSGAEPQVVISAAGTRMSAAAFKRLWPTFVNPELRSWMEQNLLAGSVERVVIAANAPLSTLGPNSPPMPKDGLSIEIASKAVSIRPVPGLPPIRDAELVTTVSRRVATVTFGRGVMDLPSGHKLTVMGGKFEVPDITLKPPPARAQFKVEGGLAAVSELLAMEPLRDAAAVPFETSEARGTVTAQVSLALPIQKGLSRNAISYAIEAEVGGFAAEKFLRGLKAEASLLRVSASHQALQIKGDMRIGGSPASIDYRQAAGQPDAEIRMQGTLDDSARARLGIDLGAGLAGPIGVKLSGRMSLGARGGRESRIAVEADLAQARVTELVPGWFKPPGRASRASFVLVDRGQSMRLEDFALDGSGTAVRGTIELDEQGDLVLAHFPTFALSDGDKASLKAERGSDGALKVVLRGDLYDGRGLVKTAVSGQSPDQRARRSPDLDLDIKVGAVTGHHGETLRGLELRLTRRAGQIRTFAMNGRLGRDARIVGDLRSRGGGQVMYLRCADAGALFRFTDIYPKIIGGTVDVAMDPPVQDNTPRDGLLNLRDFVVRGEAALERVAASSVEPNDTAGTRRAASGSGVAFSGLRAEFTRSPGKFSVREGFVWGPAIGATVEGGLDYGRNEVRLRGTFVPAYALNNMIARVPILGLFLGGGENEGLVGVTYQVVGSPAAPVLQVNPMSAVAPGIFRKLFEFRGVEGRADNFPESPR